jgi:hypothetical protein
MIISINEQKGILSHKVIKFDKNKSLKELIMKNCTSDAGSAEELIRYFVEENYEVPEKMTSEQWIWVIEVINDRPCRVCINKFCGAMFYIAEDENFAGFLTMYGRGREFNKSGAIMRTRFIKAINSEKKNQIVCLEVSTHDLFLLADLAKRNLKKYYPKQTYHMAQCKGLRCGHLDHLIYHQKLIIANRDLYIEIIDQLRKHGIDITHLCHALDVIRNERTINKSE